VNYFSEDELRCKCGCGVYKFDPDALAKLNRIRMSYGEPLIVTSGYRCLDHPAERHKGHIGAHSFGMAVDLAVSHEKAHKLLKVAMYYDVPRIGINQRGEGRFIHLDWCDELPSPTIWSY
jgi:uncharacterized protein YcbK (DUF882 family)